MEEKGDEGYELCAICDAARGAMLGGLALGAAALGVVISGDTMHGGDGDDGDELSAALPSAS